MAEELRAQEGPPGEQEAEERRDGPDAPEGDIDAQALDVCKPLQEDGDQLALVVNPAALAEPEDDPRRLEPATTQLAVQKVELDLHVVRQVVEPTTVPEVGQLLQELRLVCAREQVELEAILLDLCLLSDRAVQLFSVEVEPAQGVLGAAQPPRGVRGAGAPVAARVGVLDQGAPALEPRVAAAQVARGAAAARVGRDAEGVRRPPGLGEEHGALHLVEGLDAPPLAPAVSVAVPL
mmetsp:Transcript_105571/g.281184  ORF Transcript_105571/g.281184 Transcript_105571/m.281184 type:complete len:236 (-) Transcript_105571:272-979(-)